MKYLNYIVLRDEIGIERITADKIDAAEQAGIIDRTLLPVLQTGQGWANSRKSGYTVQGEIKPKSATFVLYNAGERIATLAVALHSQTSAGTWNWLHMPGDATTPPPAPAWAALREDAHVLIIPEWINWWAQNVGML